MKDNERTVAEALGRAHATLMDDLRRLELAALPASGEGLAELHARLEATRGHLVEHFRFEEQEGYLGSVRGREPRLERAVQHLAEEHRQLERALEALIGEAGAAAEASEAFRGAVGRWVEAVRRHEARENEIVLDAYNLDVSAED